MDNRTIAEFIFGMLDASVTSELPEEEQLQMIEKELDAMQNTNETLYYYLEMACEANR